MSHHCGILRCNCTLCMNISGLKQLATVHRSSLHYTTIGIFKSPSSYILHYQKHILPRKITCNQVRSFDHVVLRNKIPCFAQANWSNVQLILVAVNNSDYIRKIFFPCVLPNYKYIQLILILLFIKTLFIKVILWFAQCVSDLYLKKNNIIQL